ncbi:dihydrofolate reductase family protein [Brachybacterium fresconis]|uniref:Dihydrofolate reductase n=1 Tax=Brachybacterium fresconis TaxID=173363 RepID=A0ABS4YI09_9MICO|nr:dihydrofolate reductase family protein [Brachybacterium fresconis]MBP2408396.1 dihydrofolate reductase [Brachybacterium fresconis]
MSTAPPTSATQPLLVDFILSLDGCAAGEGWPGWWGLQSSEYLEWLSQEPEHLTLMGATTYRLMSQMAEQAAGIDVAEEEKESFAQMAEMPKVAFSSTLDAPLSWPNTTLVSTDAVEAVRELKQTSTRPLTTTGSIRLSSSLMRAGLVDRFRIVLFPVLTGRTGLERIWDQFADYGLELTEARTFAGGLQLLEYVPTYLPHPPGTDWER